jgi:hypothetical protein
LDRAIMSFLGFSFRPSAAVPILVLLGLGVAGAGLASLATAQENPTHSTPDELEGLTDPEATAPPLPPEPSAPEPSNTFRPTITEQPAAPAPASGAPEVFGVVLGGLDKIAARTAKFEVNLGKSISYNTLIITAHTCKTRPPEEPPESAAFLDIEERRPDGTQEKLFSGWMFASSPALNALEHPIYDVWVVSCKAAKPDTAAPGGPNS